MASSAEEITFNAAVDALVTAYGAVVAAHSAGDILYYTFSDVQRGTTAAGPPVFTAKHYTYKHKLGGGTEAIDNMWAIPGWHVAKSLGFTPLFFKIANAAGDMASA